MIVEANAHAHQLLIFDARPAVNAKVNKVRLNRCFSYIASEINCFTCSRKIINIRFGDSILNFWNIIRRNQPFLKKNYVESIIYRQKVVVLKIRMPTVG